MSAIFAVTGHLYMGPVKALRAGHAAVRLQDSQAQARAKEAD